MRRTTKILTGAFGFFAAIASAIALATGSAQVGLHAGFWLALVFAFWLDARMDDG